LKRLHTAGLAKPRAVQVGEDEPMMVRMYNLAAKGEKILKQIQSIGAKKLATYPRQTNCLSTLL
jgi:hypothetical protein